MSALPADNKQGAPIAVYGAMAANGLIAREDADVVEAGRPLTMHFGPDEVLLNLDVRFRSGLPPDTIMAVVDRLERVIRARHPAIKRIFIEAESLRRDGDRTGARSA